MNKNWTEVLNLAGQMHNLYQDKYMPLDEAWENETANKILRELGLDSGELIQKIGGIESLVSNWLYVGATYAEREDIEPDLKKDLRKIENLCADLRYLLTNVIGE